MKAKDAKKVVEQKRNEHDAAAGRLQNRLGNGVNRIGDLFGASRMDFLGHNNVDKLRSEAETAEV